MNIAIYKDRLVVLVKEFEVVGLQLLVHKYTIIVRVNGHMGRIWLEKLGKFNLLRNNHDVETDSNKT